MSTTIKFEHEGREYTLEYTKATIRRMEESGFNFHAMREKPMTVLPEMFAGAFLAHHRFVKSAEVDAIYERFTNKQELIGKLGEMYSEQIEALFDEPEENPGNIVWTASKE